MGRRSKTWGEGPSVDDPGRASAIRDHSYRTSNGMWQLPKDSEVDAEIARLADQMAAELEITDRERDVVAGADAAGEAEARWAEANEEAMAQSWAGAHRYVDSRSSGADLARAYDEASDDVVPPEYLAEADGDEAEVEA